MHGSRGCKTCGWRWPVTGGILRSGAFLLTAWEVVLAAPMAHGQSISAQAETAVSLDPVTVTATRSAERLFNVPASANIIDGTTIRDGQPGINLSEPNKGDPPALPGRQ